MIRFEHLVLGHSDAHLGFMPGFFTESDPRPAAQQLDEYYAHGGGWSSFGKGKWRLNRKTMVLKYPGDDPMTPLARAKLHNEELWWYEHAILLILQPTGDFDVTRVD